METKKNFTNGILIGIIGMLLLIITLSATESKIENSNNFQFYDLKTTKGLIFNKSTGEIKYEIIREEALQQAYELRINGYESYQYPINIVQQ